MHADKTDNADNADNTDKLLNTDKNFFLQLRLKLGQFRSSCNIHTEAPLSCIHYVVVS